MSRRALLITVFVSLALNVFLVGAVVGGLVIGARYKEARMERRGPAPLARVAENLPPERREAFRQALRGEAGSVGESLREARRARREAWRGLGADPFDARAVTADLDEARARELAARGLVERRIVAFAAGLPPAERVALAEAMARSESGRRGRGPRDQDRRGDRQQ